ncbi:RluA family pseudouridine synthase [Vibrio maerlii]|uniref:RluA family pseudouridine synthase n=1 Tax=Vibrio maerlii TaxID=2231648 RepID=UPI000E3BD9B8|nr:RluA family pseudouridine synthase [Vibrio maerlii]
MNSQSYSSNKFQTFLSDVSAISIPKRFTFPYYYTPHPLAEIAIKEFQEKLYTEHGKKLSDTLISSGNMFAILVVKHKNGQLGYLCSVRGNSDHIDEPLKHLIIDDVYAADEHHIQHHYLDKIENAKHKISSLLSDPEYKDNLRALSESKLLSTQEIEHFQSEMNARKAVRKVQRSNATSETLAIFAQQSSQDKQTLKALKLKWKQHLADLESAVEVQRQAVNDCEKYLSKLQRALENHHLESCQFINQNGHSKSLFELFSRDEKASLANIEFSQENLPKLLNHAFQQGLSPLALGEFWWGKSPYHEIRQHRNLYPVCQSKCFEILKHMLEGIDLDESPLEACPSKHKPLPIIYEDNDIVIVNKPAEFLSVSGKYIQDSVEQRIKNAFPQASGPLIVHRLDMSTSGLLVLALNAEANKHLQQQFINRKVVKRYTALLDGRCEQDSGKITLPLTGDLLDRPRQMVCQKNGRSAKTYFEVVKRTECQTLVHLYPVTGRTHQLRVHCAHIAGLNMPIVGDDLYGFKDSRLHLHAGYLKFSHPTSGKEMSFEVEADF